MMNDWQQRIRSNFTTALAAVGFTDPKVMKLGKADNPYVVVVPQADREYPTQECYYAHASIDGAVVESILLNWANSGVMPVNSTPELDVWTAFPPGKTRRHIVAIAEEGMTLFGGTPATIATIQAAMTDTNRMIQNAIYAGSGLTLGFNGGRYRTGDTNVHLAADTSFADLTAYVSDLSSGKDKWLLISVDSSGTAHITEGDEFDTAVADANNYRPVELPSGTLYLGAVRITDGMTDLTGYVQNDSDIFTVGSLPYTVSDTSPSETQAGDIWIDTSGGTGAWILKVRNEANTGWETIADGGTTSAVQSIGIQHTNATIANTTSETSLDGSGAGTYTLAANALITGTAVVYHAAGFVSTTGTPGLTFRIDLGSTEVLSGSVTMPSGVSNIGWQLNAVVTCQSEGATGTVVATGSFTVNGTVYALVKTTATTIDTTAAQTVNVTAEWGAADPANTITTQTATLDKKYPN